MDDGRGDAPRLEDEARHAWPRACGLRRRHAGPPRPRAPPPSPCAPSDYPIRDLSRPTTASMVSPSARAAKVSAMRCLSTGSASATHVVDRRRIAPVEQRAGAHRQHQRLAGARARAPGDQLSDFAGIRAGTRRAHQVEDRVDHRFADRQAAHQALRRDQLVGASSPASACSPRRRWCRTGCGARRSMSG